MRKDLNKFNRKCSQCTEYARAKVTLDGDMEFFYCGDHFISLCQAFPCCEDLKNHKKTMQNILESQKND